MKTKTLIHLFLLLILFITSTDALSQSALTDCKKNNDDPPPYAAPGKVITGLPVYLEIDVTNFDNMANKDFCIGNSGAEDTDKGCGTFLFTNLMGGQEDCGTQFCFSPRQGCGTALGNVCFWQEDPNNPGQWQSLGSTTEGQICIVGMPKVTEYAITLCRPGNGPVSIQDVEINEPPTIEIANQTACLSELSTLINLALLEPTGQKKGTWKDSNGSIINPNNVTLTGSLGQQIAFEYCYDATAEQGYDCMICTDVIYTITDQCCIKTDVDCPDYCDNTMIFSNGKINTATCDCEYDIVAVNCEDGCPLTIDTWDTATCGCTSTDLDPDDGCDLTTDFFDKTNCVIINEPPQLLDNCPLTTENFDPVTCTINRTGVPAITCPTDFSACPGVSTDPTNTGQATSADQDANCKVVISYSDVETATQCTNGKMITRTWTAHFEGMDNQKAQCVQTITLEDNKAPVWQSAAKDFQMRYPCGKIIPMPAIPIATDDCSTVTVSKVSDISTNGTCPNTSIRTITWRATDECGNASADFISTITLFDTEAPVLSGLPAGDIKMSCGQLPMPPTVTAMDGCDGVVAVQFFESEESGSQTCPNTYTIIREWIAEDACGNTTEFEQRIIVTDVEAPTLINVPTDITVECGIVPNAPTNISATDNCDMMVGVTFKETSSGSGCAGEVIVRTWTAEDVCGNTNSLSQTITLDDITPPSITCPADVQLQTNGCGTGGRLNIDLPTATDNCDGNVAVTSLPDMDATFSAGMTTVTLTATDDCGNTTTCDFTVTVTEGDSGLQTQPCPDDILITCDDEKGTAVATWEPPSGNACCSACPKETEVAGYLYIGERGGHRYYCSKDKAVWEDALAAANVMGGYLAVINDPAENQFLTSFLQTQRAFIGLTDVGNEGNFYWLNGDPVNYTNWFQLQPDNKNGSQHYGQLLPDGTWNDTYKTDVLEYIIEIPCVKVVQTSGPLNGSSFPAEQTSTVTYEMEDNCGNKDTCTFNVTVESALRVQVPNDVNFSCQEGIGGTSVAWTEPYATSCCDNCPPSGQALNGFIYMGRYNGHQYYCSLGKATWPEASAIAQSLGGYLATINDATENRLLANFLAGQSAHIGLSDKASEGRFVWSNGERVTFQNWHTNQPDNLSGAQDYVMMMGNGYWDDIFDYQELEFIIEVPCLDVRRIDNGPVNGGIFPTGTTSVTYEARDNCGNIVQRSFDINIGACSQSRPNYCSSYGTNTNFFWIKEVRLGSISNNSGNDAGYGDYSILSTNMDRGSSQVLTLSPGFASASFALYWRVFIDYNQDGDFNDSGEIVFSYKHTNPLKINFRVPTTCKLGKTRMRVAMNYTGYPSSCGKNTYGETEDYTINITSSGLREATATSRSNEPIRIIPLPMEQWLPQGSSLDLGIATEGPSLQAYPNPTKQELTIDIQNLVAENSAMVIYNSLGQQVHQQHLKANANQQIILNVAQYKTGIYFISIGGGEQQPILQKFTKL